MLVGVSSHAVYLWDVPRQLPSCQELERMTGARVEGTKVVPLPASLLEKRDLVAVAPFAFTKGAEPPGPSPQIPFTLFRWSKHHPFHWIGAAEDPKGPRHAEACYRLGVFAERDTKWDRAREWHQKAIDAGPSKWADEARWRLREMPARIAYLKSEEQAPPAAPASAPSTQPK